MDCVKGFVHMSGEKKSEELKEVPPEEKVAAVYLMVKKDELRPEDGGVYEGPLALQKEECLSFLAAKHPEDVRGAKVYTSRAMLIKDMERDLFKRLVVKDVNRLGATQEDIDAFLFELNYRKVEVLAIS